MLTDADLAYGVATADGENMYCQTLLEAMREADQLAGCDEPAWVRFVPTNKIIYIGKERLDDN